MQHSTRREFLSATLAAGGALALGPLTHAAVEGTTMVQFNISVAGWSLHRKVFNEGVKQTQLFGLIRDKFDLGAFELVNTMLEVPTASYVSRLAQEAKKADVVIPLIMIDSEGNLGAPSDDERLRAVRNHEKWCYIASDLGCHSIRVNWGGAPDRLLEQPEALAEHIKKSAETYRKLVDFGAKQGISIIIENHGGISSHPAPLVALMKTVGGERFGTLPDFGNFPADVDRYDAVDQLMPFAKAVSAKCKDFDESGNCVETDYAKMIPIVVDKHDYHDNLGIEYEGNKLSEEDGTRACRDLLMRLRGDKT